MTDLPECPRCDRPIHDTAYICTACANYLRRHLDDVSKIAGDITITVARLAKVTRSGGQVDDLGWWKTGDALEAIALPVDLEAAQRHDSATRELGSWARLIAEERGLMIPFGFAVNPAGVTSIGHPLARSARFVAGNLEWLRHHPAADEAWTALLDACVQLVRVVDTSPSPGELVGLCACGTALYARGDGRLIQCSRCRDWRDVDTARSALEDATSNAAVTASEAAVWIGRMGLVTDTGRLRKLIWAWADRGHLAAVDETPRYRFGDVLERVMTSPALRAA